MRGTYLQQGSKRERLEPFAVAVPPEASAERKGLIWAGALGLVGLAILGLFLARLDVSLLFFAVLAVSGSALMLVRPEWATVVVIVALYANLPAVAVRYHGIPPVVAGAVLLLLIIPLGYHLILRREMVRLDRIFVLMGVYLAILLASTLFAQDKAIAAAQILNFLLEGLILYLLITNVVRSFGTLQRVFWAVVLAGALVSALSLYQAMTDSHDRTFGGLAQRNLRFESEHEEAQFERVVTEKDKMRLADRAQGPIGDPNRYGQVLVILVPLALLMLRAEKQRARRAVAAGAALLILIGIVLTHSRGAFLALVGLFVFAVILGFVRLRSFLIVTVLLAISVPVVAPNYFQRVQTIAGIQGLFSEESTAQPDRVTLGRLTEMLAALSVFRDHPLLGVGPGQYAPFYSVEYQRDPEIALRHINKPRRAHNLFVEIAAETGLLGLIAFVAIFVTILRQLLAFRRYFRYRNPGLAATATALALSIVGYLGTSVFLHLAYERYYWMLLGLAGAALHIFRNHLMNERAEAEGLNYSS